MITKWKRYLSSLGYIENTKRSYWRELSHTFCFLEEIPYGNDGTTVRIRLSIGIKDPFLSDQGFGRLAFCADVNSEGIVVNFDDVPYWLKKDSEHVIFELVT